MTLSVTGKRKVRGSTAAGFVALLQGMEGILFTLLGLFFIKEVATSPEFAAAELAIKEIFCLSISLIVFAKYAKEAVLSLKTRKGKFFFASGAMTGIGNLFYILAIAQAGSSYGVILTALYPVFSMILMRFIFKEKQTNMVWFGVAIAVLGGLLFISLPAIIDPSGFGMKTIIGMVLGGLGAFMWALEGILIKKGTDIKEKHVSAQAMVTTRTSASALITLAVLLPIMASPAFRSSHNNAYHWFGHIFQNLGILIVLAISIAIVTLRVIHLYAITTIGPKLTAIIDTNNFLVPAFFNIFLAYTGATYLSGETMFDPIIWWGWLLIIPIFAGVFMVLYFEKSEDKTKEIALDKND